MQKPDHPTLCVDLEHATLTARRGDSERPGLPVIEEGQKSLLLLSALTLPAGKPALVTAGMTS